MDANGDQVSSDPFSSGSSQEEMTEDVDSNHSRKEKNGTDVDGMRADVFCHTPPPAIQLSHRPCSAKTHSSSINTLSFDRQHDLKNFDESGHVPFRIPSVVACEDLSPPRPTRSHFPSASPETHHHPSASSAISLSRPPTKAALRADVYPPSPRSSSLPSTTSRLLQHFNLAISKAKKNSANQLHRTTTTTTW